MNRGISGDPDPEEKEDGEYYTVTREIHGEREIGGCSESEVPDPGGGVQLAGPRRLGDIGGGRCSLAEIHFVRTSISRGDHMPATGMGLLLSPLSGTQKTNTPCRADYTGP
jgi:hypothetical protein